MADLYNDVTLISQSLLCMHTWGTAMPVQWDRWANLVKSFRLTQQKQLQFPSCVSLVSPELFLDLGVDSFGLFRLLAQATSHHGIQSHHRMSWKARRTGGGEPGYTSRKVANKWSWAEGFNKSRQQDKSVRSRFFPETWRSSPRWSKLLSSVKYLTAPSASCAKILRLRGLAVVQWKFAMQHVCKHLRWLPTVQTSILLDARSKWAAETSLGALEANCC